MKVKLIMSATRAVIVVAFFLAHTHHYYFMADITFHTKDKLTSFHHSLVKIKKKIGSVSGFDFVTF